VLLGKTPDELESQLSVVAPIPGAPPHVPIGLVSDLVRQRPDIRRAERDLAAATARIGVATADLFPKFYLTAAAGLQSVEATDFFDGGSRFWSIGPSVRWPIFNGGRIRQNIRVQNARQEQALLRYEQTVLTSLEEVENALVAFGREQERHRALTETAEASRRAASLANDRYRGGLVDFLDVLEAERSLLGAQDNVVQSERRLGQNLVRLYKSLGGGWES
jgi:outer membrane protein, multidrug efflux system